MLPLGGDIGGLTLMETKKLVTQTVGLNIHPLQIP